MSEPFVRTRPGPGGYGAPAQRPGSGPFTREDPLAELARLVGRDDPFRDAVPKAPRSSNVAQFPQLAAPNANPAYRDPQDPGQNAGQFDHGPETAQPDFDAQLRGSLDSRPAAESQPRDSLRFPAIAAPANQFEPAVPHAYAPPAGHTDAPPLNADLWAEGAMGQGSSDLGAFDGPLDAEAPAARSPKRTLIVLVSVLALTCGGLGATFLMREGSSHSSGGGTAPTIMAEEGPVKVASPDMSKDAGSDSNTALLEKTGSDKVDNAKVVTNQEQPIDLAQLPKGGAPAQEDNAISPGASSPSPFPAPRKVKTILIRPDGSVVGDAAAAQGALPEVPGGVVMPAVADGGSPAPENAGSPPPAPVARPSTPKSTARASLTPKAADAGVSGAKQTAAPTRTPKVKSAVVAEADTPVESAAAATPGTYAVQLAAPGTEQDAKDTASRLQKKFSGELGGLKPTIRKGESGSKSVYRVRVSNLSQDDAKALCSKLQTNGGSCFVVRN